MTKDQLIKQITEACAKVNPEIMELKFGCWIKDNRHSPSLLMFVSKHEGQSYSAIQKGSENTHNFCFTGLDPNMVILGRDITLADILAILPQGKNIDRDGLEKEIFIAPKQHLCIRVGEWKGTQWREIKRCYWNLLLPLSGQDMDCLEFINSLISKN